VTGYIVGTGGAYSLYLRGSTSKEREGNGEGKRGEGKGREGGREGPLEKYEA